MSPNEQMMGDVFEGYMTFQLMQLQPTAFSTFHSFELNKFKLVGPNSVALSFQFNS